MVRACRTFNISSTSGSVIRLLAEPRFHIAEVGPVKVHEDMAWLPKRMALILGR